MNETVYRKAFKTLAVLFHTQEKLYRPRLFIKLQVIRTI